MVLTSNEEDCSFCQQNHRAVPMTTCTVHLPMRSAMVCLLKVVMLSCCLHSPFIRQRKGTEGQCQIESLWLNTLMCFN